MQAEIPVIAGKITTAEARALISALSKGFEKPARKTAKKASKLKGRKLGKVPPKYQLPSGKTWTGRGRMPVEFAEWQKENPGKDLPPA